MKFAFAAIFLLVLSQTAQANPFCQISETDRDSVAAFACALSRRLFACKFLGEIAGLRLERGRPITQSEAQGYKNKGSDIVPNIPPITNQDEYVNAINECIAESEAITDPLFREAKKKLQEDNNKEALIALKDLYAYWLTTMNLRFLMRTSGVSLYTDPKIEERSVGIQERLNRLKIEL